MYRNKTINLKQNKSKRYRFKVGTAKLLKLLLFYYYFPCKRFELNPARRDAIFNRKTIALLCYSCFSFTLQKKCGHNSGSWLSMNSITFLKKVIYNGAYICRSQMWQWADCWQSTIQLAVIMARCWSTGLAQKPEKVLVLFIAFCSLSFCIHVNG